MPQQTNFKSGVKRVTKMLSRGFFEKLGDYCAVAVVTFVGSFLGGQCSRQALVEEVKSSFSDVQFPPLDSTYIISNDKSVKKAKEYVNFGFQALVEYKDIDLAYKSFVTSNNRYNGYRFSYEISQDLNAIRNDNTVTKRDQAFWRDVYIDMIKKYRSEIPEELLVKMEAEISAGDS